MKHDADRLQAWARLRVLSRVPALTAEESREVHDLAHALGIRVKLKRFDLVNLHTYVYEVGADGGEVYGGRA